MKELKELIDQLNELEKSLDDPMVDYGDNTEYAQGFDDGFIAGYEDAANRLGDIIERAESALAAMRDEEIYNLARKKSYISPNQKSLL